MIPTHLIIKLIIFRINQEELGYLEDEYEDLKALFQMFDFDQVHNMN